MPTRDMQSGLRLESSLRTRLTYFVNNGLTINGSCVLVDGYLISKSLNCYNMVHAHSYLYVILIISLLKYAAGQYYT